MIHPDNPVLVSVDFLKKLDADPPGTWLAQPKLDGWRRVLVKQTREEAFGGWPLELATGGIVRPTDAISGRNGEWLVCSKHGSEGHAKPMPPELLEALYELPVPDGTAFDAEWMGNRCAEELRGLPHSLHIFDMLMWEGKWLRDTAFSERQQKLTRLWGDVCDHHAVRCSLEWKTGTEWARGIYMVMLHDNPGLVDLFQQQMQDPLSEGLVVRRADSGLILDEKKCADNPFWFKVKYRNIREPVR